MSANLFRRATKLIKALLLAVLCPLPAMAADPGHGPGVHWGYSGAGGPEHWANLAEPYAVCGTGLRQSPIDIRGVREADLYRLQFHYAPTPLQVVNNGHTLQVNYNTPSEADTVNIGGKSVPMVSKPRYDSELLLGDVHYKLLQLHFHTPSEHARNGERQLMEVHLVHRSADGNLAVVGVFLKRGAHNPELQKVLDNLGGELNQVRLARDTLADAGAWLPKERSYYHYTGSLTTPPCSENVNWLVMKTPLEVSERQVSEFARVIGQNARPLQPTHWRGLFGSL